MTMSLAPFLSQIAPQPELGTWGLEQHFSLQHFFFVKRGFFQAALFTLTWETHPLPLMGSTT